MVLGASLGVSFLENVSTDLINGKEFIYAGKRFLACLQS